MKCKKQIHPKEPILKKMGEMRKKVRMNTWSLNKTLINEKGYTTTQKKNNGLA